MKRFKAAIENQIFAVGEKAYDCVLASDHDKAMAEKEKEIEILKAQNYLLTKTVGFLENELSKAKDSIAKLLEFLNKL